MRTRQGWLAAGAAFVVMLQIGLVMDGAFREQYSIWRTLVFGVVAVLVFSQAGAAGDRRTRGEGRREGPTQSDAEVYGMAVG